MRNARRFGRGELFGIAHIVAITVAMATNALVLQLRKFPSWVPKSSLVVNVLLLMTSFSTASVLGYDASMMNALNILPSYTEYFKLDDATIGLNSAFVWVGAVIGGILFAKVPDIIGRKPSMFYSAVLSIIGTVIQAASQNIGMFLAARFILGFGIGGTYVACPTYLAEALPEKYRTFGLGAFTDLYYVGALLSSGITYGTAAMDSTWAWRLPSLLQILFTVISVITLPFVPESPRWYTFQGQREEALVALAQTTSNGDITSEAVQAQYLQIVESIEFEKTLEVPTIMVIIKSPSMRKRMLIVISVGIFSMLTGSNIFSYYLGSALSNAGITDTTLQLEINIILNAWCFVVAICGTLLADKMGRKFLTAVSTGLCTIFLFIIGALTKYYGQSDYKPAIYANVAMIFLAMGSYSFAWTPVLYMYPPEVLNYQIRSLGIAICGILQSAFILVPIFAFPYAMDAIGWKFYIINGAWDIFELVFIMWYWVETKGLSLEEVTKIFDGEVHSQVESIHKILQGEEVDEKTSQIVDIKGAKN